MSNSLRRLAEKANDDTLSYYEYDLLLRKRESEHHKDGRFHPSSISRYCKRYLLLPYLTAPDGNKLCEARNTSTPQGEEIFENGTFGHIRKQLGAIHAGLIAKRRPLKKKESAYLKELYDEYFLEPASVMTPLWEFCKEHFLIEVLIEDTHDNVKGHIDGVFAWKGNLWVWEFKTWNMMAFNKLDKAELSHRIQAATYTRYFSRTYKGRKFYDAEGNAIEVEDLAGVEVWYENKNFQANKKFAIPRDFKMESQVKKLVKSSKKMLHQNKLPKRQFESKSFPPCYRCKFDHFCY